MDLKMDLNNNFISNTDDIFADFKRMTLGTPTRKTNSSSDSSHEWDSVFSPPASFSSPDRRLALTQPMHIQASRQSSPRNDLSRSSTIFSDKMFSPPMFSDPMFSPVLSPEFSPVLSPVLSSVISPVLSPSKKSNDYNSFYTKNIENRQFANQTIIPFPCQDLIKNAPLKKIDGKLYNTVLGTNFDNIQEFKNHVMKFENVYLPDNETVFRDMLQSSSFYKFLEENDQLPKLQPNLDYFQPHVHHFNLPVRKLGIIVSLVEQDWNVGRVLQSVSENSISRSSSSNSSFNSGFQFGFNNSDNQAQNNQAFKNQAFSNTRASKSRAYDRIKTESKLTEFYREFPKGYFIAEIDVVGCSLTENSTPVPQFNFTGTRFYSRYAPFRFHNVPEFRHKQVDTAGLIGAYFNDKDNNHKPKYECVTPFVPFVGQVVSFVKKPMSKVTHQTDEGHLVKFVCCGDEVKDFWNFPKKIPEALIHRERAAAAAAAAGPRMRRGYNDCQRLLSSSSGYRSNY